MSCLYAFDAAPIAEIGFRMTLLIDSIFTPSEYVLDRCNLEV